MGSERVYSPVLSTPTVYKAHGDDTSTAVLTYPVFDAEGEWIQPDGGDWSEYPLNPKVDWHHAEPIGRGEVTLKAIAVDGKNYVVPVGTTRFATSESDFDGIDLRIPDPRTGRPTNKSYSREQCLSRAAEAKFLVLNDHATGVSIEIDPLERRPLNKSAAKPGTYACMYPRWKGLGWAHVFGGEQVNPGAQTVAKAHATRDLILGGKLPSGAPFSETVRKAFLAATAPSPTTVRVSGTPPTRKSMDYPEPTEPVDATPDVTEESDTPDEAAVPTDLAQLFSDAADRLQAVADKSLHKPSNKYLAKYAEEARQLAEDLMAHADSIGDELASRGKKDGGDEPEGDEDADPAEDDDKKEKAWPRVAARPLKDSLNAAGLLVCKAFNRIARLRLDDLKPVEKAAEADAGPPKFDLSEYDRKLNRATRPVRRTTR